MILLTGAPGACTTPPSAEVQVIDISQIGPILTEIRNEIAYYNATVRDLPAAEAPRLTPGNHARPVVSFVLPQSPVTLTKPPAPRVSALPGQSDTCPALTGHFTVRSVTLSAVVSTDRTLTGGVTGTVPVSTGITIGTSPSLSRHTTSTETLQFTEYPTGGDAGAATAAGNASSTGLTEALLALDEGLRQQDTGGPPCFSPAPSDKADISPIGPNEITFATNASRTATGGLALTIGIIAFNATGQKTDNRGTTITIVFSPDHPPDAMPRPPEHRKPLPSPH